VKSTLAAAGELHLDALVDELRQVECSFLAPSLAMKQAAPLNLASRATTNVDKQTVSARGKGASMFYHLDTKPFPQILLPPPASRKSPRD
jgi:hypothetical protein